MPGYLAIDTSMGTSVALALDGAERFVTRDDPRGHTEVVGELIAEALAGFDARDVTGVVVGVGPGPFTGLRVGLAAAQAFAFAIGAPLIPVVSHDAVALEALTADGGVGEARPGPTRRVRVVQDAKRRELFVTEYEGIDAQGFPVCVTDPHIQARASLTVTADDVVHERVNALMLIRVAQARLAAGAPMPDPRPLYLRAPDVKQPGPVKRVST